MDANADIRPAYDAPADIDKTNAVLSEDDVKKAREFREEGLNGEGASAACDRIYASLTLVRRCSELE